MPANAISFDKLQKRRPGGLLEIRDVDRKICPPEALERMPPQAVLAELEKFGLVTVDSSLDPTKCDEVIASQRLQNGINFGVTQLEAVTQGKGFGQITSPACSIEHQVACHLPQFVAGERVLWMNGAQEVQNGGMITFRMFDENGGAHVEQVGLCCEIVNAL